MRSFFRSKRVMIARSPGLTEGPQIASSSFSFCSSGEILPPFIVSPTLPIGNWVRMNTKSELKVRINSIRCCSVSCEESLLEARDGRLWKKITMTRRTRRGRIQTHPIIVLDGKNSSTAAHKKARPNGRAFSSYCKRILLGSKGELVDINRVRLFVIVAVDLVIDRDPVPISAGRSIVAV